MDILTRQKIAFSGFLAGEGCFRVDKKSSMSKSRGWTTTLYRPHILIALRQDDNGILFWAKEQYGGCLMHFEGRKKEIKNQNPYSVWQLQTSIGCVKVCEDFLKIQLPSKKIEQAQLLKELCEIKNAKKGHKGLYRKWYTEEEQKRQEEIFQKLKQLKLYSVK